MYTRHSNFVLWIFYLCSEPLGNTKTDRMTFWLYIFSKKLRIISYDLVSEKLAKKPKNYDFCFYTKRQLLATLYGHGVKLKKIKRHATIQYTLTSNRNYDFLFCAQISVHSYNTSHRGVINQHIRNQKVHIFMCDFIHWKLCTIWFYNDYNVCNHVCIVCVSYQQGQ